MAQLTWYISASPIANDGNSNATSGSVNNVTPNQESTSRNQNESLIRSSAQIIAVTSAKKSVSYLTSNVGKYSGNHRNQVMVDNISRVVGYGIATAINPALGALTMGFDAITTAIDNLWDKRWDTIRSQQLKARAGEGIGYRK